MPHTKAKVKKAAQRAAPADQLQVKHQPRGGKLVSPPGQARRTEVHARNTVRKAAKRATPNLATRTAARLKATGPVAGVSAKGGYTKAEAQKVLLARRKQKYSRRWQKVAKQVGI